MPDASLRASSPGPKGAVSVAGSYSDLREALQLELPPGEKLLLLVLRVRQGSNDSCWPSQETLAGDTGLTPRSIRSHTVSLEARGLLKIARFGEDGRQYRYYLNTGNGFPHSAENISSSRRKFFPKQRKISTKIEERISQEEGKECLKNEKEEVRGRARAKEAAARLRKSSTELRIRREQAALSAQDLERLRADPVAFWASQGAST